MMRAAVHRSHAGARLPALLMLALVASACGDDSASGDGEGPASMPPVMPMAQPDAGPLDDADAGERGTVQPPSGPPSMGQGRLSIAGQHPLTTSRLLVRVVDTRGAPLNGVPVSAGAPPVLSGASGFAHVDRVHGQGGVSDVFAFSGDRYTHARVPIADGETSHALLVIGGGPTGRFAIADAAAALQLPAPPEPPATDEDGGVSEPAPPPASEAHPITLQAEAGALQQPWGEPASGPVRLHYVLFEEPDQAAALPGAMLTTDGVALLGRAALDLRVLQGVTELELSGQLRVEMTLPSAPGPDVAGVPHPLSDPRLYHFDPALGAFVERGVLALDGDDATLTIDALGLWLIGAPGRTGACASGIALDVDGTPMARAAIRSVGDSRFASTHTLTDETGAYCVQLADPDVVQLLLAGDAQYGSSREMITVASAGSCGDAAAACASLSLQAAERAPGCVTGIVQAPQIGTARLRVAPPAGSEGSTLRISHTEVAVGEPFCVEVAQGAELSVIDVGLLECGAPVMPPVGAAPLCGSGQDGCRDVGTITCCAPFERCGDAEDDDCDGMVDEGCMCGDVACATGGDRCCTADDRCAARSPNTGACAAVYSTGVFDNACPTEMLPPLAADQGAVPLVPVAYAGCCSDTGTCGLSTLSHGCVPRNEIARLVSATAVLAPVACTAP